MHEFSEFAPREQQFVRQLVEEHPFALITSVGERAPVGTHVPIVIDPRRDSGGPDLREVTLLGHMAAANPQWHDFEDGAPVLVVFTGAGGYVSPTLYGVTPAAPTWNYAAVHVTGTAQLVTDRTEQLRVIEETVRQYESRQKEAWDPTASKDYFAEILPGTAAFTIETESVKAMFKFSQDKPADIRERVESAFAATGCPEADRSANSAAIAEEIRRS